MLAAHVCEGGVAIENLNMIEHAYDNEEEPISGNNPSLLRSGVQHALHHLGEEFVVRKENLANLNVPFALECNETETFPLVRREVPTPFSHTCCGKVRK